MCLLLHLSKCHCCKPHEAYGVLQSLNLREDLKSLPDQLPHFTEAQRPVIRDSWSKSTYAPPSAPRTPPSVSYTASTHSSSVMSLRHISHRPLPPVLPGLNMALFLNTVSWNPVYKIHFICCFVIPSTLFYTCIWERLFHFFILSQK